MAKRTNAKISVNTLNNIISTAEQSTFPLYEGSDVLVTVKKNLEFKEMLEFVNGVVSSVIEESTGEYMPEIQDFLIRIQVIESYTNIRLPQNISKKYDICYNTNLVERILEKIYFEQYTNMVLAIDNKIKHSVRMTESITANKVNDLLQQVQLATDGMNQTLGQISTSDFSALVRNIGKLEDVDERKIVHAVFDAQESSDNSVHEELVSASEQK